MIMIYSLAYKREGEGERQVEIQKLIASPFINFFEFWDFIYMGNAFFGDCRLRINFLLWWTRKKICGFEYNILFQF